MADSRKQLSRAILALLNEAGSSPEAAQKIAAYLITERRTKELNSLLRELEELRYKQSGELEVTAEAANRLSDEAKQQIKQLFADQAETIKIHEEINKQMLGGVKVRALDKVADFSVQARLQRLRAGRNT